MFLIEVVVLAVSTFLGVIAGRVGFKRVVVALLATGLLIYALAVIPALIDSRDPGATLISGAVRWSISFATFVVAPFLVGWLSYGVVDYIDTRWKTKGS